MHRYVHIYLRMYGRSYSIWRRVLRHVADTILLPPTLVGLGLPRYQRNSIRKRLSSRSERRRSLSVMSSTESFVVNLPGQHVSLNISPTPSPSASSTTHPEPGTLAWFLHPPHSDRIPMAIQGPAQIFTWQPIHGQSLCVSSDLGSNRRAPPLNG